MSFENIETCSHGIPTTIECKECAVERAIENADTQEKFATGEALDKMIADASVPNLGAMFRQAYKQGVIVPGRAYR